MHKTYKVLIVGGGAAGIFSAVELTCGQKAFSGEEIIILEKLDRIGKKLVSTGNGQGNLTNKHISKDNYYGDYGFIKAFLEDAEKPNIQEYFYKLGMPLSADERDRVYPVGRQASSVIDFLMSYLNKNKVNVVTGTKVTDVIKEKPYYTVVTESGEKYYAENVILAFGGKASKQFGTDGTSYILAEKFGHKKTPLFPSLVQLKTDFKELKSLKGVKEKVRLSAFDGKKLLKTVCGDLLFTDYGISGDAVFALSAALTDKKSPFVVVEFLPFMSANEISKILKMRIESGLFSHTELLNGLVNKRISKLIMSKNSDYNISVITDLLKNFTIKITGNLGFDYAQVTKGGIVTDGVNPFSMKSKFADGLYLVGELLGVDGDCGGYNLDFAFSSGIKAALDIKNKF